MRRIFKRHWLASHHPTFLRWFDVTLPNTPMGKNIDDEDYNRVINHFLRANGFRIDSFHISDDDLGGVSVSQRD